MGTLCDIKVLPVIDAESRHGLAFPAQGHRVENYAVPDEVHRSLVKDAAGYLVEHDLLVLYVERMPGIGTALETGDHVIPRCEKIHDLSFSFIAPLEA